MKSLTFGNFQTGMVDNPSDENKGGFEFASGMDIFSEPGVLKACNAMTAVSYGVGASPADVPRAMVDTTNSSSTRAYIMAGSKILESTDGTTWNLFLTNSNGTNYGLGIWAGYVVYASADKLGRTLVGNAAGANDNYITTLDNEQEFHPILAQGGTLKIGAGRYIASLDESFNFTARAMKLNAAERVRCLAEYLTNLFVGTRLGAGNIVGAVLNQGSSVYSWRGTVLSSGSALPDVPYPMNMRGMNALVVDGRKLYAFPDRYGDVLIFDGAGFVEFRKLVVLKTAGGSLTVNPNAVTQHVDNSILFAGDSAVLPGVFQIKDGAICQAFVPSTMTPGVDESYNIGFVKTSFNGTVFIGYYKGSNSSYHVEKSTSDKQNNAVCRTLWHRFGTDKRKRHIGIKLNLKPMAASTSVVVSYRTDRNASFTGAGAIDSTNQDKPLIFSAQPRSREIQYMFTYVTATTNTPELMTYDPMFEVLNTVR